MELRDNVIPVPHLSEVLRDELVRLGEDSEFWINEEFSSSQTIQRRIPWRKGKTYHSIIEFPDQMRNLFEY